MVTSRLPQQEVVQMPVFGEMPVGDTPEMLEMREVCSTPEGAKTALAAVRLIEDFAGGSPKTLDAALEILRFEQDGRKFLPQGVTIAVGRKRGWKFYTIGDVAEKADCSESTAWNVRARLSTVGLVA